MIPRAAFVAILSSVCAFAQLPVATPTQDPGVARATLIDKPEVRAIRVEIQPGATRSMHKHDDVRSHMFMPISGSIELTIGSAKPVVAVPGQAYYMEKGTLHGFRNTGSTPAMVYEVFSRDPAPVDLTKLDATRK
jgi:quercetin dioxygenase-like cupin family protein